MKGIMRKPLVTMGLIGITSIASLTACGSSGTRDASASSSSAGIPVPSSVRTAGELAVGTSFIAPPFMYYTNGDTPTGVDVDLLGAIGKELGLKVVYSNVQYESLVPAVTTGRYDVGALETADTAVREKTLNFIDYYKIEDSVIVRAGNPGHVSSSDLCGVSVSSASGSFESETLLPALDARCKAAGKPALKITDFSDTSETTEAVLDGRDEAFVDNVAVNAYTAKVSGGKLEALPGIVPGSAGNVAGFYLAKNETALITSLVDAIKALQANGTWQAVFKKWGISGLDVAPPTVNGKPWTG